MLTEYEKGFLEGAIDADGCITICRCKTYRTDGKRKWAPQVKLMIGGNNRKYLEKIKSIIGTGGIGMHERNGFKKGSKQRIWYYWLSHSGCRRLFPQIQLIVKEPRRRHAIKILNYMARQSVTRQPGVSLQSKQYIKTLEHLMNTVPKASIDDTNAVEDASK